MAGRKINIRRYLPLMGLGIILAAVGCFMGNDKETETSEVMQTELTAYEPLSVGLHKGKKEQVALEAPTKLEVKNTEEGISLNWQEVADAICYEVEINGQIVAEVFENTYMQQDVIEEMSYTYRVRPKHLSIVGEWSLPLQVLVDENKGIESQEVAAIYNYAITYGSQIVLHWEDEKADYILEVDGKKATNFSFKEGLYTYIHQGITPGSTHTYLIYKSEEVKETVKVNTKVFEMKTESHNLKLDGKMSDWSEESLVYKAGEHKLYSTQNESQIALAAEGVKGEGACFFLDMDLNGMTGYQAAGFAFGGADVLVDGETVYTYAGNGTNWKWQEAGIAQCTVASQGVEVIFDKALIGAKSNQAYGLGYNDAAEVLMPSTDKTMQIAYTQYSPSAAWTNQAVNIRAGMTSLMVSFEELMFATGYEVSLNGTVLSTVAENSCRIRSLKPGSTYEVSVRPVMGNVKGSWSKKEKVSLAPMKEVSGYIAIDGMLNDWSAVPSVQTSQNVALKVAQDDDNLYVCIEGEGAQTQIFIDSDQQAATGYQMEAFMENGADYVVDGTSIYSYSGNGEDWNWLYLGEAESSLALLGEGEAAPKFVEMIVSKTLLGISEDYEMGVVIGENLYLSQEEGLMFTPNVKINFDMALLKSPAVEKLTATLQTVTFTLKGNADKYIVEFNGTAYEVLPDEDENIRLGIRDLTPGKAYAYRLCSIKGNKQGAWSDMQLVTTSSFNLAAASSIVIDTNKSDWLGIKPIMTNKSNNGILYFALDTSNLHFLIQDQIGFRTETIFIETDPLTGTGYTGSEWPGAGIDYMIENGVLYSYAGDGESWSWQKLHSVRNFFNCDGTIEGSLPLKEIGLSTKTEIWIGLEGPDQVTLPKAQDPMFVVSEVLQDN